jgi:hypothetical protein
VDCFENWTGPGVMILKSHTIVLKGYIPASEAGMLMTTQLPELRGCVSCSRALGLLVGRQAEVLSAQIHKAGRVSGKITSASGLREGSTP